jgi:hypothetical protein
MAKCLAPDFHVNGFEHLDLDLDGADDGFDLGFKFWKNVEAREPYWVLYVSYSSYPGQPKHVGKLPHFEDSRPSDEARDPATEQRALIDRARPLIANALRDVVAGRPLPPQIAVR